MKAKYPKTPFKRPKKKPATGKKKTRHIMAPSKRTTAKADASENRRRATLGDRLDSPAADLISLIRQIAGGGCKTHREGKAINLQPHLAIVLAKKLWTIIESQDGNTLRDMAALVDAPVAREALAAAYAIAEDLQHYAEGDRPHIKSCEIVAAIMHSTGCDERTAKKAIAEAGLKNLFGWRSGRPRTRS
jgi:hypothetical protein